MPQVPTARLILRPVSGRAAVALSTDRPLAAAILEAELPADWPHPGLLDVIEARATASEGGDHFGIWAIIDRSDATVVGDVGFKGPPDAAGTIEVGYSVLPDRQARGYAAEAASAIVEWALSRPNVRAVIASCDHTNTASIRTLERIGFRRTGEADGEIRWRYAGALPTAE